MMEDLVQKLREASEFECAECALHYAAYDCKSDTLKCGYISCIDCVADSFNALADRIEREYAAQNDALVGLAVEMFDSMKTSLYEEEPFEVIFLDNYRERLEELGVKVDG